MSVEESLRELDTISSQIRLQKLLDQHAITEEQLNAMITEAESMKPPDGTVEQLALFRKSVGEEMWATIANNPSLPELLKSFIRDEAMKSLDFVADGIVKLLPPETIDRNELKKMILSYE
jgi:hypothetical protein